MSELTPERLAELRRIAEDATPGPLTVHRCDDPRYAAFVDAPRLGPEAPELAVFLIEDDARFFAEFDRDTVLAMLNEVEHLRREVREWMCDGCNTVYPGPPQPGIWCVQCPRCGGDTAPRGVIERRRLEREIERLRREREVALDILSSEDIGDGAKVEGARLILKGGDRGWPTRESERAMLVAEVGECCRGADPLCAAGCLVEAALRRRLMDKEGTA